MFLNRQYAPFSFAYFCYFTMVAALIAFWPLWVESLGFSSFEIGVIAASAMASKIFAPSVWGIFADRTNSHRRIFRICSVLAALCFVVIFFKQSFWWILLICFSFTFFWNAVMPQVEVLTLSALGDRKEEYTSIRAWGSISFVIVVISLGYVFEAISIAYLPMVLMFCLGLIVLSSVRIPNKNVAAKEGARPALSSILAKPKVIAFLAMCFLVQLSHGPYYTFFSLYMDQLNYSKGTIGWFWSLGVIAEVLLYLQMARIFKRFSLYSILAFSLFATAIRWILIGFFAEYLPVLIFAQFLHAFSFGAYHAVGIVMIQRFFSGGNEATGMGLYSGLSFGLGGTVGAYISGLMWDTSTQMTFVFAAIVALLALVVARIWLHDEIVHYA